ncbi:MAG: type VII toxin-antitoxin system MntA family adenylyltransferase antitoxin [archaeon]
MTPPGGDDRTDQHVDPDRVARVVREYPVRLAVLFGSHARGTATTDSDVDVAVAYDEDCTPSERLDRRIALTTDLVECLGTNDVDVTDLDSVRPDVGRSALQHGTLLVGGSGVLEEYLDRFERATRSTDDTHEERMDRFDALLERLEGRV